MKNGPHFNNFVNLIFNETKVSLLNLTNLNVDLMQLNISEQC